MTGYMPNDSFQADDAILKEVRPVGLENPGLFCYANSIIQFLLTIEDVFILFQSKENKQLWQDMPMCRSLCSTTRGFSKEYRRTFRPS